MNAPRESALASSQEGDDHMTSGRIIRVSGVRLRDGKLVPCRKHLDVSTRLKQATSKRVRVVRRTP
jgi:hypothetical protein